MTTLRQACNNCTVSKRKCIVLLPKCARCAQRGLACVYNLEHLNAPSGHPEEVYGSQAGLYPHGYCLLKTVASCGSAADPAISKPGQSHTLELVRRGYQAVPNLLRAGKPAIFVHPKFRAHSDARNHLDVFATQGESGVIYEDYQRLVQLDAKTLPMHEALTALQALLIYMGTFILSPSRVERDSAEESFIVLSEWTQNLLESVQRWIPRHQSSWQAWILGESVRRTIIMSYGLSMSSNCFKYGYCSNWLFMESLPFDKRPGLWMAQSPQAWIASAGVKTGADVGERLSSLHEFAEDLKEDDQGFCGDLFLFLLMTSHNGLKKSGM